MRLLAVLAKHRYQEASGYVYSWPVLSGYKVQLRASPSPELVWVGFHPCLSVVVLIGVSGETWILEQTKSTNWPGPMYPPGFEVLDDNQAYLEAEDELDIVAGPAPRASEDMQIDPDPAAGAAGAGTRSEDVSERPGCKEWDHDCQTRAGWIRRVVSLGLQDES